MRYDRIGAGLVAALTFALYLATQAPGLYYTDTGELAAAAATWGVAHPTGYPLFTLIAHVWTLLPWPSVIGGLNVLAAVFMALASGTLVFVLLRVLAWSAPSLGPQRSLAVAVAGAGLFAFGPTTWAQTTAIEVYGLQTLLFVCTLLFTLRSGSGDLRDTTLAGFFFGLMLANHLSSVMLAPGLFLLWWYGRQQQRPWRADLPWLLVPSLLGPALYALLPLRSAANPPINWGMVHRDWHAFWYHVRGTQFGVWMFSDDDAMRVNAEIFADLASQALLYVGWIAVVAGIVILMRRQRSLLAALLVMMAGNLVISLGYAIPDIDAYFLPSLVVLTILAVVAVGSAVSRLPSRWTWSVVLLPVVAVALHLPAQDHRDHVAVEAYTRWTLANVEPRAIVITRQWDVLCSAFWYLQTVEGFRPDVAMIDKELLRRTWYLPYLQQRYPEVMQGASQAIADYAPWVSSFERDADAFMADRRNPAEIQQRFVALLNAIVEANPDRPVYLTPELIGEEQGFAAGYDALPVGPLLLLTKDPSVRPVTKLDHVDRIVHGLQGRSERLDEALRSSVLTALATSALYAVQVNNDRAYLERVLVPIGQLDPSGRFTRTLRGRVGP